MSFQAFEKHVIMLFTDVVSLNFVFSQPLCDLVQTSPWGDVYLGTPAVVEHGVAYEPGMPTLALMLGFAEKINAVTVTAMMYLFFLQEFVSSGFELFDVFRIICCHIIKRCHW